MHLAAVRESYRELEDKNTKLQQAYDRLKELDRLKSNFLATVSHELRTPLTSIIGYSEMLVEGIAGDMSDEQREFVRTIHEKGEQLLELIKGLLDLSKLESGTMSMRKQQRRRRAAGRGRGSDAAARSAQEGRRAGGRNRRPAGFALGRPRAPAAGAAQPHRQRAQVHAERRAGARSWRETRAWKRAGEQEGAGFVLLGTRRPAVELRVADTGIGIPEAERERVFDAFYQVDSSSTREQGGTGLGLSIVKRLVEAHDGTVRIEDNGTRGTVFVVTIPCRRATIA